MPAVEPQGVLTPITEAAIFLVADRRRPAARTTVRDLLADVSGLRRSVGFRVPEAELTCVVGIGAALWDRAVRRAAPGRACTRSPSSRGATHTARRDARRPAVPHPRPPPRPVLRARRAADRPAARAARRSSTRCTASAPSTSATCSGSSTAPRTPRARRRWTRSSIGDEDPEFAGGSYVVVQKYLHDLDAWDALPVEEQERAIGRDEAQRHRAGRRRQAGQLARGAEHDRRRRRRGAADHALQHALRQRSARASSAPTSSATPAART